MTLEHQELEQSELGVSWQAAAMNAASHAKQANMEASTAEAQVQATLALSWAILAQVVKGREGESLDET